MNYISNVTSRLAYWGRQKLNDLKWRWVRGYTAYILAGAANLITFTNIFDVLNKQATSHERIQSYKHLDWTKRRLILFPTETKQHFISDPEKIQKLVKEMRNGEQFSFSLQPLIAPMTGAENLLLCPSKDHRRLRSPLEILFSLRHLSASAFAKEVAFMTLSHVSKLGKTYVGNFYTLIPFFVILSLLGFKGDWKPYFELGGDLSKIKPIVQKDYNNKKTYEEGGAMAALQKAEEKGQITEEEKISSTLVLLAAGAHTTTSFLQFAIQELHNHPEYREKIENEWKEFIAKNKLDIQTVDDYLNALHDFVFGKEGSRWLENCYLEIQRLHPIVPDLPRVAEKKMDLEGLKINKGDEVHLNIAAYHRDPTNWEEPDEFRPERFEKQGAKSKLMTFGLGSQSCIGKFVVPIEVKMILGIFVTLLDWTNNLKFGTEFKNLNYDGVAQTLFASREVSPNNFSKKTGTEELFKQVSEKPHPFIKQFGY